MISRITTLRKSSLMLVVSLAVILQGCATVNQKGGEAKESDVEQPVAEHKETSSGAAVGAIAGGLIGALVGVLSGNHNQASRALIGAAAGAAAGGAAGGLIGKKIEDRHRDREQSISAVDYRPELGLLIDVHTPKAELNGDVVKVSTEYTLLTPEESEVDVTERYEVVSHNGKVVVKYLKTLKRSNGGYTPRVVELDMSGLPKGQYAVNSSIAALDKSAKSPKSASFVLQ